jgi:molecular chaperone DnaJ
MNPYKVLGVRENASEDEVREAYHKLVKKYHPDQYSNNPLSDLAQEKLKEINQAYDMITKSKSGGTNGFNQGGSNYGSYQGAEYSHVRANLQSGNYEAADAMLEAMQSRDAEWYYLKGVVELRRGWYGKARENIQRAVNMDPSNAEYRNALNQLDSAGGGAPYGQYGGNGGSPAANTMCNVCAGLACADCLCNCCH